MVKRAAVALVAVLVLFAPSTAAAHNFGAQGPPHVHIACSGVDCHRWITADGTVWQGPWAHLVGQFNYVLVRCSYKITASGDDPYNEGWQYSKFQWGPYANIGEQHPYCRNPRYLVPGFGSPFLAGWAVNA